MSKKQVQKRRAGPSKGMRHLTSIEFRAITFVATLILAGIAIIMRINEPVVWGFLGTAIGIAVGQAAQGNRSG
jgi:hypothetical protein